MREMTISRGGRWAIAGATLAAAGIMGWAGIAVATPDPPPQHGHARHEIPPAKLAEVRRATAQFHDVDNALASGRIDLGLCVDQMGHHYADPATFDDGVLDPKAPEALVYADDGGRLRLVAVEWVSTTSGEVLDVPLHFNESVNLWVLHAWVWNDNPDGTFADLNPRVGDCPE